MSKKALQSSSIKNLILTAVAVLSAITAFALHYFCNIDDRASEITLNYLAVLTLFVTLSANCTAGLIVGLLRHSTSGRYMCTAAVISVIEVIPFPLCRIYFSMSDPLYSFKDLCIQAAIVATTVLLLTAVINLLRKKYKIEVSVKKR